MKHYGDDLKVMLQVGQIRDEKKTVSNICHGRSEWLLRIVPVYNISSMWLSDAAEYAKQEGIYRFGVKKAFKMADNYIEAGLNKVINSAKDEYGRKFILDLFDKSEDFMRSHTDGIFYPVFNYLSKLGFKHPNVSAALGVSLAVAEFTVTAEYQLMQRFKSMWGYTVPTIADLNDFPRLLRPILVAADPAAPSVNISDDTTCLTALKAFINKAYGNEMSETASGEALAINPVIQQDIARLEKQKDKKTIA